MTEEAFRKQVAENIIRYRKEAGLTQLALAEKLHYSDKAVSKWERSESLPDAYMLLQIAEVFGITLNDLTGTENRRIVGYTPEKRKKHAFITALSVGLVWLTASVAFFILKILGVTLFSPAYLFLYAVPVSFIVGLVFQCIWGKLFTRAIAVSGLVWSLATSVVMTVPFESTAYLFLTAAIFQVLIGLWFGLRAHSHQK